MTDQILHQTKMMKKSEEEENISVLIGWILLSGVQGYLNSQVCTRLVSKCMPERHNGNGDISARREGILA